MQAPFEAKRTTKTPSGLTLTVTTARTATLSDPADVTSLVASTETTTVNGNAFTRLFQQAPKLQTLTTPMGRTSTTTIDALGRTIGAATSGLTAVAFAYDAERGVLTDYRSTAAPQTPSRNNTGTTVQYEADRGIASDGWALRGVVKSRVSVDGRELAFGDQCGQGKPVTRVMKATAHVPLGRPNARTCAGFCPARGVKTGLERPLLPTITPRKAF